MDRDLFITSLDLGNHPMKNVKRSIREDYYRILTIFLGKTKLDGMEEYRLSQYKKMLVGNNALSENKGQEKLIPSLIICKMMPWRFKYKYYIICDIALIVLHREKVKYLGNKIKSYLNGKHKSNFQILLDIIDGKNIDMEKPGFVDEMLSQYLKNIEFISRDQKRYIVTANISAGKSTFINALVGKKITRTSQEICTGAVNYIYNKSFEDGQLHIFDSKINVIEDMNKLSNFNKENERELEIGSNFRKSILYSDRICIMDTPGVNAATNKKHRKITRKALKEEKYEKLIYIFNANKLGTDEEYSHLKWVLDNIPKEKIIFVLNKIDSFNLIDDSVSQSICKLEEDLIKLGYKEPRIYPISSYFSLLLKMKENGDYLNEDELDEYNFFEKKFNREGFDLSIYFKNLKIEEADDRNTSLSKKCGISGMEKLLFGGD